MPLTRPSRLRRSAEWEQGVPARARAPLERGNEKRLTGDESGHVILEH